MSTTLIDSPNPEWFTTTLTSEPDARVYPFFGTEDGDLIGLGHQDRDTFADAVTAYWDETDPTATDMQINAADDVQHRWALVLEGDPDDEDYMFWVTWYVQDDPSHPAVTAETPGAVPITIVTY